MKVLIEIDGDLKEFNSDCVEVIYEDLPHDMQPTAHGTASLHVKLTHEGVILDVYKNDEDDDPRSCGIEISELEEMCH